MIIYSQFTILVFLSPFVKRKEKRISMPLSSHNFLINTDSFFISPLGGPNLIWVLSIKALTFSLTTKSKNNLANMECVLEMKEKETAKSILQAFGSSSIGLNFQTVLRWSNIFTSL